MKSNRSLGEEGWANISDTKNRGDRMNGTVERDPGHLGKEIIADRTIKKTRSWELWKQSRVALQGAAHRTTRKSDTCGQS